MRDSTRAGPPCRHGERGAGRAGRRDAGETAAEPRIDPQLPDGYLDGAVELTRRSRGLEPRGPARNPSASWRAWNTGDGTTSREKAVERSPAL